MKHVTLPNTSKKLWEKRHIACKSTSQWNILWLIFDDIRICCMQSIVTQFFFFLPNSCSKMKLFHTSYSDDTFETVCKSTSEHALKYYMGFYFDPIDDIYLVQIYCIFFIITTWSFSDNDIKFFYASYIFVSQWMNDMIEIDFK